jgi:hypothetical protein
VDDFEWVPVPYWPDPLTALLVTTDLRSGLGSEFISLAMRCGLDTPDRLFSGADIASVVAECGIPVTDLAEELHAPPEYVHACIRGWHRLGVRGLALFAEALGVPIAAFFLDADGTSRLEVRRYHAYRAVAPHVTILGGGSPP